MLNPNEVRKGTAHPRAMKLHHFLWKMTRGQHQKGDDGGAKIPWEMKTLPVSTKSHEAKTLMSVQPDERKEPTDKFLPLPCP